MSQFRQDNRFTGGMGSELNDLNQPYQKYRLAKNLSLREVGNLTSLVREKSDLEIDWGTYAADEPTNYEYCAGFRVLIGGFEYILLFVNYAGAGSGIYLHEPDQNLIYKLYDDRAFDIVTYDRTSRYGATKDIDCRIYRDGDITYAVWLDSGTGPRMIPLVFQGSAHDQTALVGEYIGMANCHDCLFTKGLAPLDIINPSPVNGGSLKCGTYQLAYRYVNTKSGKASKISLLTSPVAILPRNQFSDSNMVRGGGPGTVSDKKIRMTMATHPGYHRAFYDSTQVFIVEWLGASEAVVKMLDPQVIEPGHYNAIPTASWEMEITGDEGYQTFSMDELLEIHSPIGSATTLEIVENRLWLGGITYTDLDSGMTWQDDVTSGAQTLVNSIASTSVDPMTQTTAEAFYRGDYSKFIGYRGGEVYRFGVSYYNKFQEFSEPDRIRFNQTRYSTGDHANTYQLNWIDPASSDWKFPQRMTPETSITGLNTIRSFGMRIPVYEAPNWAYGAIALRRKTVKNILGMTPIIHAMSINGAYHHIDPETADDATVASSPWLSAGNYDTDGSNDTFEPKVLSYGHLQNINVGSWDGTVNANKKLYYPKFVSALEQDYSGAYINTDGTNNRLLYIYPLEWLANDNGEKYSQEDLDGAFLEVFDCVLCTAYNAMRSGEVNGALTQAKVKQGDAAKYVWIFAPEKGTATWAANNTSLLHIYERTSQTGEQIPYAPQRVRIGRSWTIGYGSLTTTISDGHSNDEKVSAIGKANGLLDLVSSQANNEYGIWKNSDYRYPGSIINQRAILVTQEESYSPGDVILSIQDPTKYLYDNFVTGAGDYNAMFDTSPAIDANAVVDGTAPADPSSITSLKNPWIIEPGSGIPVYMANITRDLLDDRYGDDEREEYVYAGAQVGWNKSTLTILNTTPAAFLELDTYGGDTVVCRAMIKIRDNAPVITTPEVSDEEDTNTNRKFLQYQGAYADTVAANGDRIGRVSAYENYVEFLDVWVESEVNGHWLARSSDSYPSGITGRLANAGDAATYPDFTHSTDILTKALSPQTYLYNFAYSKTSDQASFFTRGILSREILEADYRIHYSTLKVNGSTDYPFERFLPFDFYDLPQVSGKLSRLFQVSNERVISVQAEDIKVIFTGATVGEDVDNRQFTLSSSSLIGTVRSTTGAPQQYPAVGAERLRESINTPFGVFVFDRRRKALFKVAQSGIQDITTLEVRTIIDQLIYSPPAEGEDVQSVEIRMLYEHDRRRLWVLGMLNDSGVPDFRAITYLCDTEQWESYWEITNENGGSWVNDIVSLRSGDYAIWSTSNPWVGQDKIFRRRGDDTTHGSIFGASTESEVVFILNNREHSAFAKVLKTVQVQGDGAPSSVQAIVRRNGVAEQDSGDVALGKERRGTFIFSSFEETGITGTRIRGEQIEVTVRYLSTETGEKSLESVQTTYRLDHRSKTR